MGTVKVSGTDGNLPIIFDNVNRVVKPQTDKTWELGTETERFSNIHTQKITIEPDTLVVKDESNNEIEISFNVKTGEIFYQVKTAEGDEFLLDGIQSQRYLQIDPRRIDFTGLVFEGNFDGDLSYNINDIVDFDLTTKTYNSSLQVASNTPQTLSNFYSVAKNALIALQTGQSKIIKVATDGRTNYASEYLEGIDGSFNLLDVSNSIVTVKSSSTDLTWTHWNSYDYLYESEILHYMN